MSPFRLPTCYRLLVSHCNRLLTGDLEDVVDAELLQDIDGKGRTLHVT
jgi:hypothetical protein